VGVGILTSPQLNAFSVRVLLWELDGRLAVATSRRRKVSDCQKQQLRLPGLLTVSRWRLGGRAIWRFH